MSMRAESSVGESHNSAKLYTPGLLSLSAALAAFPLNDGFENIAETGSRICGSSITLGVNCDADTRVQEIGMLLSACAIGQSSAAVLALSAKGRPAADFHKTLSDIEAWLAGQGALPEWPEFDALAPALPHAGRHGALLLPWQAMIIALSTEPLSSAASSR